MRLFLDLDDEVGLLELALQPRIFAAQTGEFVDLFFARLFWLGRRGLQTSLGALFSEVLQRRIIDAFAAQDCPDLSSLVTGIGQAQDTKFVFAGIALSLGQVVRLDFATVLGARFRGLAIFGDEHSK